MIRVYVYQRTKTVLNDSLCIVYRPAIAYSIFNSCMNVMIVGEKLQHSRLCSSLQPLSGRISLSFYTCYDTGTGYTRFPWKNTIIH